MKTIIIITSIVLVMACRKDPIIQLPPICNDTILQIPQNCLGGDYNQYSTDSYDFILDWMISPLPTGPFFEYPDPYRYDAPAFNPNNPYEIAYLRIHNDQQFVGDLCTFSFCTGEFKIIADNFLDNLDWGSNGWLIYTAMDYHIYKIKPNGDSLTQLSNLGGYNRAGKWNPSGTLYWNYRDDGIHVKNKNGEEFHILSTIPFSPEGWVNDSTFVGWRDNNFYSISIPDEELTLLNNNWTCATCPTIFDRINMDCFVTNSSNVLKYDLDGSNAVDTIMSNYPSYYFTNGDISNTSMVNGKLILTLVRQDWLSKPDAIINARRHLLLMNTDASDKRLIELPE